MKKDDNNPFNRILGKNFKHKVLGQKIQGSIKRPGHTINKGIELRKKTLLKEWNSIEYNHHNNIIDKRYESNINKKIDKINTKRIKNIKQRGLYNKNKYNLDDNLDDNVYKLTHLGKEIFRNNDNTIANDDDDDEYVGLNNKSILNLIKNGNTFDDIKAKAGLPNKNVNKTKIQIKQEHILYSRYKKMLKQFNNSNIKSDIKMINNEYKDDIMTFFEEHRQSKKNNSDNGYNPKLTDLDQEYQKKLIEFENDLKSGVSSKKKSDYEKAKSAQEYLEILEQKRIHNDLDNVKVNVYDEKEWDKLINDFDRCEQNIDDNEVNNIETRDNDTNDNNDSNDTIKVTNDVVNGNEMDVKIDDKFIVNDKSGFGGDFDDQYTGIIDSDIDINDNDDDNDSDVVIGAEPVGGRNILEIAKENELKKKELDKIKKEHKQNSSTIDWDNPLVNTKYKNFDNKSSRNKWSQLEMKNDDVIGKNINGISYIIDVPKDMNEFNELFDGKTCEQQISILKRIRINNSIKLSKDNIPKMEILYDLLMKHFKNLCQTKYNQGPLFMKYIDVVTRCVFALSHDIPIYCYTYHLNILEKISNHLNKDLELNTNEAFNDNIDVFSYMPSGYTLFYLKLISYIFPNDIKTNTISASLKLILCKIITDVKINGGRDVCCYLFCMTLLLDMIKKSKLYIPELIHGLYNLLRAGFMSDDMIYKTKFELLQTHDDLYFIFKVGSNVWHNFNKKLKTDNIPVELSLKWIFISDNNDKYFQTNSFKLQTLYNALNILYQCTLIYDKILSFNEIFTPFLNIINKININNDYLSTLINNIRININTNKHIKMPLHSIKVSKGIETLEPEFDPELKPTFLRMKVKNEKALLNKQTRMLKKAKRRQIKKLMREYQKDTQFMMNQKTQKRILDDNKRHSKWVNEYMNLVKQQRDSNAFQMVGKKQRKKLMKQGVIRGW